MAQTGYNNDYYTSAYILYLENPPATDDYIVDASVYFDTAPLAGGGKIVPETDSEGNTVYVEEGSPTPSMYSS